MRRRQGAWPLAVLGAAWALAAAPAAGAQERAPVATLEFGIGQSELAAEHRAVLDEVRRRYPPASHIYTFEGDHDATGYRGLSRAASRRVSERLAETRWQNAARHLGVAPLGVVRATGRTEVRVYVELRRRETGDSLAVLGREIERLQQELDRSRRELEAAREAMRRPPARDTVLAVARFEKIQQRSDKWVDRRWWETQLGVEIGLLRQEPQGAGRPSGATLVVGNGSPAYHPFEITVRLDFLRLGNERAGVRPALRWYDWELRLHYGDDREADTSFFNRSDPLFLLGLDVDVQPWSGARLELRYAGVGGRVHARHRPPVGVDHYDLRLEQRLVQGLRFELQAVYDERFEKSLAYAGGWIARAWPLRLGEISVRVGFVEQLDAFAATAAPPREDPVSTLSLGFAWQRSSR